SPLPHRLQTLRGAPTSSDLAARGSGGSRACLQPNVAQTPAITRVDSKVLQNSSRRSFVSASCFRFSRRYCHRDKCLVHVFGALERGFKEDAQRPVTGDEVESVDVYAAHHPFCG